MTDDKSHQTNPDDVDTQAQEQEKPQTTNPEKKRVPNPTGKGGFGDNPQNRSDGRWNSEESISFWYNKLGRMSEEEFKKFRPANMNQRIARYRLKCAAKEDKLALDNTIEVTDRTEGKPKQGIDMAVKGDESAPLIRGFVIPTLPEHFVDGDIAAQAGAENVK
ncbi:hypothetical protein CQ476_10 [TM7 phage DolZOral124_53_65]|nr:hypothetical protein CQ476_10 [TM7 phage DolZOral124_53_65]